MGQADLKERSRHPKKTIAADPDFALWVSTILRRAIFSSTASPKPESALQRASERKLEIPDFLVIRYNIAVLKGDQEQMDRAVALARGKRRAEHWMAHEEALALARSGRLQAARQFIEPGHGSSPARGGTRGGSELPGRTSGVGSRLRECCRSEKERHGGAGAFERPGCRIRRRPCPGSFGRLLSIATARR